MRQRLEARRDPVRLKEHLFWLMWHYWLRAEFEQCVVTCDDGIALAAQLGSPPVQYASIKGLALTDLGRFDEAWASFQEEVADDAHPFGRCMREFGVAIWLEALGALDRAEAVAKEVLEEAGRLSRTWMQRGMVDLLTVIAARRGAAGAELAAWVAKKSDEIGFHAVAARRRRGGARARRLRRRRSTSPISRPSAARGSASGAVASSPSRSGSRALAGTRALGRAPGARRRGAGRGRGERAFARARGACWRGARGRATPAETRGRA